MTLRLTGAQFKDAAVSIAETVEKTRLIQAPSLSPDSRSSLWLKPECLQVTGSFKIRGAANKIASLDRTARERGIVTASSGNHGRAVACVAGQFGVDAVICMSTHVPPVKVDAIRGYGARVVMTGDSYDGAEAEALKMAREEGMTFVSAFDDPHIIAGQGTIGLEIVRDLPDLDTVIVPVSGGGLISGVGAAVRFLNPDAKVIGVSMDRAPMMHLSLRAGRPVEVAEEPTLADALMGSIGVENQYTFAMVRDLVDEVVLVSEDQIGRAMVWAMREHGLLVEGGGAVGLAAVMGGAVENMGENVVVVVSGGNVDRSRVDELATKEDE